MKFGFWSVGKAHDAYIKTGVEEFTSRIANYFPVEWKIIPPPKNTGVLSQGELKKKEAEIISAQLKPDDYIIALDENGKEFTSEAVAKFIQQRANESTRHLVFLIGGAFGIDDALLQKAKLRWSLSQLTFPHHLVRLILAEQVYRSCTILANEKYHHR